MLRSPIGLSSLVVIIVSALRHSKSSPTASQLCDCSDIVSEIKLGADGGVEVQFISIFFAGLDL